MAKKQKKVAVVHCQGGSNAVSTVERSLVTGNCSEVVKDYPEGIYACEWGCLGQGSCVSACKFNAMYISESGTAEVIRDKCVGCGLCVKVCPKGLISLILPESTIMPRCSNKEKAAVARKACKVSCIACGICEKNCPSDAIHVIDNQAVIDESKCIACGMCAIKCPQGVIMDVDGIMVPLSQ